MTTKPTVSVYIPTRNRQALLARALESVLAQDHRDIEVIVVDDGSTDHTAAYLAAMAAQEPRLTVLRNEHPMGAPQARNRAIHSAKGAFITGLDDDDHFPPGIISAFLAAWQCPRTGPQPIMLYGIDTLVTPTGEHTQQKESQVTADVLVRRNVIGNQVFALRETWLQSGGFNPRLPAWQDLDLWLKMLGPDGHAELARGATQRIDLSHDFDRISRQAPERIEMARDIVVDSHVRLGKVAQFHLFCQLYSSYYGLVPSWADIRRALRICPSWEHGRLLLSIRRKRLRQQKRLRVESMGLTEHHGD